MALVKLPARFAKYTPNAGIRQKASLSPLRVV
jgi:hypothetical protein